MLGLSVINKKDLKFVEEHLASIKVPFGVFEKEVLVAGACFTLNEIKKSFTEILKLRDDQEALRHLVAELTEYIQKHHNVGAPEKLALEMLSNYLKVVEPQVNESILKPINVLLNSVPADSTTLLDWLNRANHLFKTVEDDQNVLLKYMGRFHYSLRDIETNEVITTKVKLEIIVTAFSAYLREVALYAKANSTNIDNWRLGFIERQKTNPEILRMVIEKSANKMVFLTQLMTFAVAVIFVLVGIYADDIFESASAKDKINELNVRNGLLVQRSEELLNEIRELKKEIASLRKGKIGN